MPKLICSFAGWCEIDTEDVKLQSIKTGQVKTTKEWMKEVDNLECLDTEFILHSFTDMYNDSTDGEFINIDFDIEDE